MRTRILLPMLIAAAIVLSFQTATVPPVASVIIDPAEHPISMYWKDDSGRVIGNIGALKDKLEQEGHRLLLAMNGGMYTEDQSPLGVYVENGKILREPITKTKGYGNFYMQPNGVFGLDAKGKAFILTTAEFGQPAEALFATQSGPMLVVNDTINEAFKETSTNLNIRNGVGILPDGKVVFAMTREPMNFHAFARFFREQGCTDALYLDGVISRAYMPAEGLQQMGGALGVLIAVME
jgi:uncharacterized protein YigE (DUF2233 family)